MLRAIRRPWAACLALAALACSGGDAGAPGGAASPFRPDVLLVSVDTLRADHLSSYGYPRATSPGIDALGERSVVFENAYSHSPKTAPSHMSLMTGLHPEVHGVVQMQRPDTRRLSDEIPTLATLLRDAGYRTAAITGGGNVAAELGFDQGMDSYAVVDDVEEWIDAALREIEGFVSPGTGRTPYFLFLHTFEVHSPYLPREPYRSLYADPGYAGRIPSVQAELERLAGSDWGTQHQLFFARADPDDPRDIQHLKDLYDGSVRLTDTQIRRLLDWLDGRGLLDDTLVVFLSDHGEEFHEHGRFLHDHVYQEVLHVPLVVHLPGARGDAHRGERERSVVRLVDVLPTILDLLGLPAPDPLEGTSLLPRLEGAPTAPARVLSSWRGGGLRALRLGDWKLIRARGRAPQLYDLASDPEERVDLAERRPEVERELARELAAATRASGELRKRWARGPLVSPHPVDVERLRALGYIE